MDPSDSVQGPYPCTPLQGSRGPKVVSRALTLKASQLFLLGAGSLPQCALRPPHSSDPPLCCYAWHMGPNHRDFSQTILFISTPSPCSLGLKTGVPQGWQKRPTSLPSNLEGKASITLVCFDSSNLKTNSLPEACLVVHINSPLYDLPEGPSIFPRSVCI